MDLPLGAPLHVDTADPFDLLERRLQHVARELRGLGQRFAASAEGVGEDRGRRDIEPRDRRFFDLVREARARLGDALPNLGRGFLDVDPELEDDRGGREPFARLGSDPLDPVE